jgi:hypothetical protein
MKSISVLFYGYKNKEINQSIQDMINNKSTETILDIHVFDQININRIEKFPSGLSYNHIHWDSRNSKFIYRNKFLKYTESDYVLIINGSAVFGKNWDKQMIELSSLNNCIISGNYNPVFDTSNIKFFPKYTSSPINDFEQTFWVSKSFIFGSLSMMSKFSDISILKYEGEELALSLLALKNGIKVYGINKNIIDCDSDDIYRNDYIPFSTVHGYNKLIDSIKGKTKHFDIDKKTVIDLSYIHNYNFFQLSELPYYTEDEEYDLLMSLDNTIGNRFLKNPQGIY